MDHGLEHIKALLLIGIDGFDGAVAPQADAPLQFAHGVDMIHPVFVHHPEHDDPLQLPHQRQAVGAFPEGGFPGGIDLFRQVFHFFNDLIALGKAAEALDPEGAGAHKQFFKGLEGSVQLLLALGGGAAQAIGDSGGDELPHHAHDLGLDILPVQHLAALTIDDVALLVHHVVIFQDALAGLEVAAFHGFLGLLNGAGEHLVVQGHVLIHL